MHMYNNPPDASQKALKIYKGEREKEHKGREMSVCFEGVRNDLRILSPSFVIPIPVNYYCSSIVIIYTTHPNIYTDGGRKRGENKSNGEAND